MLKLIANYDPVLKGHLVNPRQKNVTFHQEYKIKINDIIGKHIIQKSILEQIRKAKFFSIMVDEVTSHNMEVMPLCIRFRQ